MLRVSRLELRDLCGLLGYDRVRYDRHDILDLIDHCKIPLTCRPRAVPIDPTRPLRPRNVAIIQQSDLHLLTSMYERTCSIPLYIMFVQVSLAGSMACSVDATDFLVRPRIWCRPTPTRASRGTPSATPSTSAPSST